MAEKPYSVLTYRNGKPKTVHFVNQYMAMKYVDCLTARYLRIMELRARETRGKIEHIRIYNSNKES